MNRDTLIRKTVVSLSKLPDQKIQEIADFADFLLSKSDYELLIKDIQRLSTDSSTFNFLNEEAELYSIADLKKK